MAKKTVSKMPEWVSNMGRLTDGIQADPTTGEVYPVGLEIADATQLAIPAGMRRPPSLKEQMEELFRIGRLRDAAEQEETIDEANDFDDEDLDPHTPWETDYEPLLGREISPAEFHEKYKDGSLIQELTERFSKLERQSDLEQLLETLESRYNQQRGAGVSPAPSEKPKAPAPKEPPAEQ